MSSYFPLTMKFWSSPVWPLWNEPSSESAAFLFVDLGFNGWSCRTRCFLIVLWYYRPACFFYIAPPPPVTMTFFFAQRDL